MVSIRAALTGGDPRNHNKMFGIFKFQSAPPSRAATMDRVKKHLGIVCFNPRRPHGRRPSCLAQTPRSREFQSAPPSRAATPAAPVRTGRPAGFNPRRPHGRRLAERVPQIRAIMFQSAPPSRAATTSRDVSSLTQRCPKLCSKNQDGAAACRACAAYDGSANWVRIGGCEPLSHALCEL